METALIQCDQITKCYGKYVALDHVCIQIKQGEIYGIIGKNGAGKTTLMRILTGVSVPTSGIITLFGKSKKREIQILRRKIGSLIEYPGIVPYLTAQENLQLYQTLRGMKRTDCKRELEIVGLLECQKKKAKDFSLGMKQRLGIAIALLGMPEVLILDEPINGLDPIGVAEIRKLMIDLCKKENITILISSHNLPQLYEVATQYLFIDHGEILKSISSTELERQGNSHCFRSDEQLEKQMHVLEDYFLSLIGGKKND